MGNCKYCGQLAGFLRRQHQECAEKNDQGQIITLASGLKIRVETELKTSWTS